MTVTNTFIYLIGFAGTGKLTIATELQKTIPSILVDNHFILNVVFSLIDPDGITPLPPKVWENARKVRNVALDTIRHLARPNRNFIFTNELREGEPDALELFEEIAALARDRDALLFPVRLLITPEELSRRVISPERRERFKEINSEGALKKAQRKALLSPPGYSCFDLDVTTLSAVEAASAIQVGLEGRNKV